MDLADPHMRRTEQVGGFEIEGIKHVCDPMTPGPGKWISMCGDRRTKVGLKMINVGDVNCDGCAAVLFALLLKTGRISAD